MAILLNHDSFSCFQEDYVSCKVQIVFENLNDRIILFLII